MFALKVTSLSSYEIPPSSYSCPGGRAKIYSPSKLPVSVPMEFLPVPIAAHVGVQRHVRPQGYQSQFLWNSSQFLWLPKCGCKNIFTLKVTSLSSYGIPSSSYSCQVGVQRCVRPQSYQSQFLWNPPSSYSCPGGGAKVCSPHVKINLKIFSVTLI